MHAKKNNISDQIMGSPKTEFPTQCWGGAIFYQLIS
jgi:hypothetical protein